MDYHWSAFFLGGAGAAAAYLLATVLVSAIAHNRLFRPQAPTYTDDDTDILKLTMANGLKISALYLPNPVAKYTLLLSHGNMADLGLCLSLVQQIHSQGFSVLVYDYPGYGTSEGKPTETGVYMAIDAAYNFLTQERQIPSKRIIAYGRSLGGGPTVDLATRKPLAGVILECIFASTYRVRMRWPLLPNDKFRNIDKIGQIRTPILMIHGKRDETIPFWHAKMLYDAIKAPKQHLWISHASHDDIEEVAHHEFWQAVHRFCEGLEE